MYKALFSFKKTHPSSLTFSENDQFIELPGAAGDKNWYYVINWNGTSGYVPKNYVEKVEGIALEEFKKHVDSIKEKIKVGPLANREKGELLAKVDRSRINFEKSLPVPAAFLANVIVDGGAASGPESESQRKKKHLPRSSSPKGGQQQHQQHSHHAGATGSSSRSSTPPKSCKKRAAPLPPGVASIRSSSNSTSSSRERSPDDLDSIQTVPDKQQHQSRGHAVNSGHPAHLSTNSRRDSNPRRGSIPDPSEEQLRVNAREIIEIIRNKTGLSYHVAQSTAREVLSYVSTNFSRLDRNVPALLCELEQPPSSLLKEPSDLAASADSKALEAVFEELSKRKEDDQQRNWMLHEDEGRICDLLRNVCNRLQSGPTSASLHVLKRFKYYYVNTLIEFFQMETRGSIRSLLIEAFMLMCSLDTSIISMMLSSVLPLELVQDIYQTKVYERLRNDALLLTVIFSKGEPMPVHYFDQIGRQFVEHLLDAIEEPHSREFEVECSDAYLGVLLSYNLQFHDRDSNLLITTLARKSSVKTFIEKVLLLLNREEDPSAILEGEYALSSYDYDVRSGDVNSTQKIILDIFEHRDCHKLFYTNDLYVLIDIIVRQLSDLSSEDPRREVYVRMCELVLRHSNYDDHLHRFRDLEHCFMRILEEEDSSDKKKITEICHEISAFSSLVIG